MYSLTFIICVVSEKKAFEHFPIGFNVNLLYQIWVLSASQKSKMAATAGHKNNIGPYGKMFVEDLSMIIPGQFGFNCPGGFKEEAF
jgi:hypothetical protein